MVLRTWPDWFNGYAVQLFNEYLTPLKNQPNLKFLQIGAYSGDASVWLLENVLTDPTSTLTDVDTWRGSNEKDHQYIDFNTVFQYYKERTAQYTNLNYYQGTSDDFFKQNTQEYDFIYIDGSHESDQVLRDATSAGVALKSKGLLSFDDYQWGLYLNDYPKLAIDGFIQSNTQKFGVKHIGLQAWLHKI